MLKYQPFILDRSVKELGFDARNIEPEELVRQLWSYSNQRIIERTPPQLPLYPAPERHPYIDLLPINRPFNKYIIGTFPPITYQADRFSGITYQGGDRVSKPQLPFYHGNRQMLWKYLIPNEQYLSFSSGRFQRRQQIIDFLTDHQINYADIIEFCQRAEYKADDANLYNIILNKSLIEAVKNGMNLDILMVFNTGSLFTSSGMSFSKGEFYPKQYVFDMFVHLLIQSGNRVEIQVENFDPILVSVKNKAVLSKFKNILVFKMLVNGNYVNIVAGPSPANGDGMLQENEIYKRFKRKIDPNNVLSLGDSKSKFKEYVYQTALLGDFSELHELNID